MKTYSFQSLESKLKDVLPNGSLVLFSESIELGDGMDKRKNYINVIYNYKNKNYRSTIKHGDTKFGRIYNYDLNDEN